MTSVPSTPSQSAMFLRNEDARLLSGQGAFVSNAAPTDALQAVFVRSPYAHAKVAMIDTAQALQVGGVVAVFTLADFASKPIPRPQVNVQFPIKVNTAPVDANQVSAVGQPVALVLARNRSAAQAGADAVFVDYEAREVVLDFAGQPLAQLSNTRGSIPASPSTVVVRVSLPRVAASPLESRAAWMRWDAIANTLFAQLSTQTPARAQAELAAALGIRAEQVRVVAVDVGGAFGGKASVFPEDLWLARAAQLCAGNIVWQALRSEDLVSAPHGRGSQLEAAVWADEAGRISVLSAQANFALGSWLTYSAAVPMRNAVRILPGPYRIANVAVEGAASASNAAAVGIYRGAGRPEAVVLMERAVDALAARLKLDPLAVRQANVWQSNELPRAISELAYQDSADFPALMNRCAQLFDYASKRGSQAPLQGIGIALYSEPCGAGGEAVRLTALANGSYLLATGATAQGQGRETAYAQIAAQALGCDPAQITVTHGDTAHNPAGIGALASRSTAIGGSAILAAVSQLKSELIVNPALPRTVEVFHSVPQEAWASGCVMVSVRVEAETGALTVDELVWVDDAGLVINEALVHGQLMGGMAQGLGQALMERIVYDEYGQLITGSLMDYALPRATDMPFKVTLDSLPTPSLANALGAKGVGEAGCIGVPAALLNASYDALRHVPTVQLDFPLTAQQLWRAMQTEGIA